MALGIAQVKGPHQQSKAALGAFDAKFFDVTFDNSYPTGGEAIVASDFGMHKILGCCVVGAAAADAGAAAVLVRYDHTNGKLQCYETAAAVTTAFAELANASAHANNLKVRLLVIGIAK